MTRLIDADALFTDLDGTMAVSPTGYIHGDMVADMIGDQPTVDAVPVIRCKDCIWNREKEWVDCYMSGMHGRNVNNFCSQGKRREE